MDRRTVQAVSVVIFFVSLRFPGAAEAQDAKAFREPVMKAVGTMFRESTADQLRALDLSPTGEIDVATLSDAELVKAISPTLSDQITQLSTPEELAALTNRLSGWALDRRLSDKQRAPLITVAVAMHREVPDILRSGLRLDGKAREMIREMLRIDFEGRGIPLKAAKLSGRMGDFYGDNAPFVLVKTDDPALIKRIPQQIAGLIPVYRQTPSSLKPFKADLADAPNDRTPPAPPRVADTAPLRKSVPAVLPKTVSKPEIFEPLNLNDFRLMTTWEESQIAMGGRPLAVDIFDKHYRGAADYSKHPDVYDDYFLADFQAFVDRMTKHAVSDARRPAQGRILDVLHSNLNQLRTSKHWEGSPLNAKLQLILIPAIGKVGRYSAIGQIQLTALFEVSQLPKWRPEGQAHEDWNDIMLASLDAVDMIAQSPFLNPKIYDKPKELLTTSLKNVFKGSSVWKRYRSLDPFRLRLEVNREIAKIDETIARRRAHQNSGPPEAWPRPDAI